MWPLDLAYAIVNYAIECGFPVSNLRLQKLMYFCQLKNYRQNGTPLLYPGSFEAWSYGPVVRDVYIRYSLLGGSAIKTKEEGNFPLPDYLKDVIDTWLRQSPWALVNESHKKGGAWDKTYIPNIKQPIPENLIEEEARTYA